MAIIVPVPEKAKGVGEWTHVPALVDDVSVILADAMEVEATNEDCSWLPFILDIIKCMDKDSMDVNQELTKLKTKIQETREKILAMPEIESSPGEQQEQLKTMREKVDTKTQLLQKYKGLCVFDSPKS
ncbi:mediator of RNA polymerase II transcription subunit 9-like [Salvelinus fontinalis]|nr:mediator of RNA polymerase II transcription subunit 9-like [Salvelinus fontinalis]